MEILDIVLQQLGLVESSGNIDLAIARVSQQVKNYCNLEDIPPELNFTVADMVVSLFDQESGETVAVERVEMGDTSYTFAASTVLDTIMRDYQRQLQQFRKLRR